MTMTRYAIEMTIPSGMDPSSLLERMQEIAVEVAEECHAEDDESDGDELTEDAREAIRNEVSVGEAKYVAAPVDFVNGFPVVARVNLRERRGDKQGRVVLVDRGEGEFQRWVTGAHFVGDDGWYCGHYFEDFDEAKADLIERARGR
jgi:hypothetical protein